MAKDYIIKCACGHALKVTEDHFGQTGRCPKCARTIYITRDKLYSAPTTTAMTAMQQGSRTHGEDGIAIEWQEGDVILDLYDVKELLGRGGMGSVHLVHHRRWDIDLAVKAPRALLAARSSGLELFERECETWVNLGEHPNIVKCFYVRRLGGIPRVFAEYVQGGSLSEAIASRRLYRDGLDVALERTLDIAIQFAQGLAYAHGRGLIHRDVKPANVMLTSDGTAKVTDFGIAAVLGHGEAFVAEAAAIGTPLYAPPEQRGGQQVGRQSDMWSFALSVLEMFVGALTWMAGPSAPRVLDGYLEQGPELTIIPPAPDAVVDLLRRCFRMDPIERPRDFGQIADELRAIYGSVCGKAYVREAPSPVEESPALLCNRAMSYLDLGRVADAEAQWQKAFGLQPDHAETIYNRGLYLWRAGRITDRDLVTALSQLRKRRPDEWLPLYLLAHVHLERGDVEAAQECHDRMARKGGHDNDWKELAQLVAQAKPHARARIKSMWGHNSPVTAVYLGWDGSVAVSGSANGAVRLWDMTETKERFSLSGHKGRITSVMLSADGRHVLSASEDGAALLWDAVSGQGLRAFTGHGGGVTSACMTGDGRRVITAAMDGIIRIFDATTGAREAGIKAHPGGVRSLVLAEFGHYLLSGGMDGKVSVWDLATGGCQTQMEGHQGPVLSVCLRRDGRYALSAGEDGTLRLWEVGSGKCIHVFKGHRARVTGVCLDRNGAYALAADETNTMLLWEVNTGRCLFTFQACGPLSLSGNGQFALTGTAEGKLHLWSVACGAPMIAARMTLCRTETE